MSRHEPNLIALTLILISLFIPLVKYHIKHWNEICRVMNAAYPGMLGKSIMVDLNSGTTEQCEIVYFGQSGHSYAVRTPDDQIVFATHKRVEKNKDPLDWEYYEVQDQMYRPFDRWRKPRNA